MKLPKLFYSFRARLLLVLASLLVATMGVQYYLNRREETRDAEIIAEQERALAAGFALAVQSISSRKYLVDLQKESPYPLLEKEAGRVINILVVDEEGKIEDSLDPAFNPQQLDDGSVLYRNIADALQTPLVDAGPSTAAFTRLLRTTPYGSPVAGEPRAFPFKVDTDKGTNYIIVVLGSAAMLANTSRWQALEKLWPTFAIFLVATLVASILLWRFTRPLTDLSEAARRVAHGDLDFRVPAANRRDEMGVLASNFNEMIARLDRTRELETRLNQIERSAVVGRLASAIAHEIRNPLNYINLTLDHLRTTLAPEDSKRRELFGRLTWQVKQEVARINTRITEFLKYTRPAKLEMKPTNVRAIVEDALNMVTVQGEEGEVETHLERDGEIPLVPGDAESLRSLFTNLIINGMQAMEGAGGSLTVKLSAPDGRVRVEVQDTGRGIPPESISQIFEPYFSTKETGTGLGLAIVKKAVDEHGGTINVESQPGAGTTFTVELPTERRAEG